MSEVPLYTVAMLVRIHVKVSVHVRIGLLHGPRRRRLLNGVSRFSLFARKRSIQLGPEYGCLGSKGLEGGKIFT
jgi:hypothetical protein